MNDVDTILNNIWKDQCAIVGRQSVRDLLSAIDQGRNPDQAFISMEGGADFDYSTTVSLLVQAVTLIKLTVDVYEKLRLSLKRKPTESEISSAAEGELRSTNESLRRVAEKLPQVAHQLVQLRNN
jgi:hypothetical protein